jgi:hypothetical protein
MIRSTPTRVVKILSLGAFLLCAQGVCADTVEEQLAAAIQNLLAQGSALKAQKAALEHREEGLDALG